MNTYINTFQAQFINTLDFINVNILTKNMMCL